MTAMEKTVREELFRLQDKKYRDFQAKLIPNIDPDTIIGVRLPAVHPLAKDLLKREDVSEFLRAVPHAYYDENQLHAFVLNGLKDYDVCLSEIERFLPYVDNWAVCDSLAPKVFRKHRTELVGRIKGWLASGETYTVRFGIGVLMRFYLDEAFDPAYPAAVAAVRSDEYYVNMMIAWYFATALAKQYEAALPYLEDRRLDPWTHNKTIQKAVESYRVTDERKAYLKTLRL